MRLPSLAQKSRRLVRSSWVLMTLLAMLGAGLALVVNVPRALACPVCIAPDKITLSGESIIGTASITDPELLASFGAGTFMGFEQRSPITQPVHSGLGIELIRYYKNTGVPASFWTAGFDHMRYYPGAPGQPGFIFYEGPVSAEAASYAQDLDFVSRMGKWFALTKNEDNAMQQMLHGANVNTSSVPPAFTSPGASSVEQPFFLQTLHSAWLPVALLLMLMVGLLAVAVYRLRSTRHRPPFAPVEEGGE